MNTKLRALMAAFVVASAGLLGACASVADDQWFVHRPDDTMTNVGVLRAGGQTAPYNAPGRKGRLTAVTVQYQILGGAQQADLKIWGFD